MITPDSEKAFWNGEEIVDYFSSKEADPRVLNTISDQSTDATNVALDLGCGGGRHTVALAEAGYKVLAVDINPAMLMMTARKLGTRRHEVILSYGYLGALPSPDNTFDLVVSTGVIHQARSAENMNAAIADVARTMKPQGVFVGNMFVNDVWDNTYTTPNPFRPEFIETREGLGMSLVSAGEATDMFVNNGFELLSAPIVDFKQENTGPRGVFRFLGKLDK